MQALVRHLFPLAKPRIVLLVVFIAAAGTWKAAGGQPDPATMLAVILAVAVAAAGSNLVNQGLEADIDAVMRRTRGRAVASRQVSAFAVIAVGLVLVAAAVAALAVAANLLAGLLTLAAAVTYVLVYTVVLKRRSWNNIVIGGAAGAFPPLIGAAAVSGQVDALGLYMFAFVFFWTPPHFWTLSLLLREDYAAARGPNAGSHCQQARYRDSDQAVHPAAGGLDLASAGSGLRWAYIRAGGNAADRVLAARLVAAA